MQGSLSVTVQLIELEGNMKQNVAEVWDQARVQQYIDDGVEESLEFGLCLATKQQALWRKPTAFC